MRMQALSTPDDVQELSQHLREGDDAAHAGHVAGCAQKAEEETV